MSSPTLKIKRRLSGAAGIPNGTLTEGELAANFVDNKVYIHNGTTSVPIAGKGEFVDLPSEQSVTGKKNFTTATVSTAPSDANDVVRKTELDAEATTRLNADLALGSRIDALGSAFNYVGTVVGGGSAGAAFDLSTLTQKDAGDYYKVASAGWFVLAPAAAFYANANDGLVFNLAAGIDKLDNTDSTVAGTADEITVTGSADTGFTVALASTFKTAVDGKLAKANNLSDLASASTARTNLGLGTIATQNANAVTLTGGTIDGVSIGGTTAAAGAFTSISATENLVGTGTNQITDFIIDAGTF